MEVNVDITGVSNTIRALYQFNERLADRVVLVSMRLGAGIFSKLIKKSAPYKSGRLRKAIITRVSKINKRHRNGKIGLYVVVKKGKKRDDQKGAFYGSWVEHGHNTGAIYHPLSTQIASGRLRRDRRYRSETYREAGSGKKVEGKHYVRNTFNSNKETVRNIVIRNMEEGTARLIREIGRL